MHQQPIHHLQRGLLDVLMRAVNRIARLEAHHRAPAQRLKPFAQLDWREMPRIVGPVRRLAETRHRPAQQHLALRVQGSHAGVVGVGRAVHSPRLGRLVVVESLPNFQFAAAPVRAVQEIQPVALAHQRRRFGVHGQRDRQRPGLPVRQVHVL